MAQDVKAKGLGRGLSALLGDTHFESAPLGAGSDKPTTLPIEYLRANPNQVRKHFDESYIEELTASIKEKGILQPLIVRPLTEANSYEIVAGERRWRAAQRAALHDVPVVVMELSDREAFELSLIENIQRADLNPIEESMGYRALLDQFGHTQEELATIVGKSRSHIANALRLLVLPEAVLAMIGDGSLSAGHARALLGVDNLEAVAKKVVEKGLNVRQTEALVRALKAPKSSGGEKGKSQDLDADDEKDADTLALEKNISDCLGLRVSIDHKGENGGQLRIAYKSLEQLDEVCRRLSQE